jgi:uncharacterized surface protein with fasciclin (FAS1) repeats
MTILKKLTTLCSLLSLAALALPISGFAQTTPTIVQIAQNDSNFSTLVSAVTQAGLVDTLNGTGDFTVFAPTNQAFADLGSTLTVLLKPENKALLTDIIRYHALLDNKDAANIQTLSSLTTLQGDTIATKVVDGKIILNDSAEIVNANVDASNGVVHAINKVLLSSALQARVATAVAASASSSSSTTTPAPTTGTTTVQSGGFAGDLSAYVVAIALVLIVPLALLLKKEVTE